MTLSKGEVEEEYAHNYFAKYINSKFIFKQPIDPQNRPSFYKSVWRAHDTECRKIFENYCAENKIKLTAKSVSNRKSFA